MSFVIKATVYMTAAEYDAVEVKRGDIEYIVDDGNYLKSYVGDIRVDTIDFSEFTEEQKAEIKSWAQEAAEQSAQQAEASAIAAKQSEDNAKASEEQAAHYADIASKAQGYDQSAREAALAALKASNASVMAATKALTERVLAESFTHGGTGAREGENTDNARYYKDLAKAISGDISDLVEHVEDVSAHVDAVALEVEADRQDVEGMKADVTAMKNAAALSEQHAAQSESNAINSANAAALSESKAADSAADALDSQNHAKASENAAALSEQHAAQSESNALGSANNAALSETNAADSSASALQSKNAAAISESNASGSANAAAGSAAAALDSENKAKLSEQHADASETAAAGSATAAEQSAISAYNSANSASGSATAAHDSEVNAKASENQVAHDASEAASSAEAAEQSEQDAAAKAVLSESWAVGGTGTRTGEDTNNAEYWAEQARQASPDGKADKVIGATAGDLAGLDATGNLTDSGIPGDKVARQDGWYDELHSGTAGNLVDSIAPSTNRKFGFDTACGDVSISDDGTADPTLIKGTTYVKNQLVGDSKVIKDVGQGVVTSPYAVSGDIDHAYIKGRSLVRNQLVPASVEKEGSSSNGIVEVSDAVAGDALALWMVAPRSVVVNQLVQNGDFSDGTTGWSSVNGTVSVSSGVAVYEVTTVRTGNVNRISTTNAKFRIVEGHVYFVHYDIKTPYDQQTSVTAYSSNAAQTTLVQVAFNTIANTWSSITYRRAAQYSGEDSELRIGVHSVNDTAVGDQSQIRNIVCIDLTQYFNGDQTLIDSITSWDDLVAYDPRFASYVEYNTGTVEGVQPQVKVTGKNLFDKSRISTDYSYAGDITTVDSRSCVNVYNTVSDSSHELTIPILHNGAITISCYGKQSSTKIGSLGVQFRYIDGTITTYWTECGTNWTNVVRTSADNKILSDVRLYNGANGLSKGNYIDLDTIQLELGSTATSYEPYHDGGTAQAPAPLFAVGNAADEYEAVAGVTTHKMGSYTFTGQENWKTYGNSGYAWQYDIYARLVGANNIICDNYVTWSGAGITSLLAAGINGIVGSAGGEPIYFVDYDYPNTDIEAWKAHMAGKTIYYELATPTTSASTPAQISLQAGNNTAMQTDGGRTASSLALGYDGTSFDVPLKTGRSYLVKKDSTSTLVTDGTAQSVIGGQDMIVDLNTLYNNVSSLISQIIDWNALVSDTGMYGSYTSYDEGTVVHSDQTEAKACGKNLWSASATVVVEKQTDLLPVKFSVGTYTLSALVTSNDTDSIYSSILFMYEDGTYDLRPLTRDSRASLTWTFARSVVGVRLYASNSSSHSTGDTATWTDIQLELGSTPTAYEPYYDGGTSTAGLLKGVPGSVYDQLDAVTGNVTTRIGSYTFTGNETWNASVSGPNLFYTQAITNAYRLPSNSTVPPYLLVGYTPKTSISPSALDLTFSLNSASQSSSTNIFFIKDTSCSTTAEIATKLAGKTVYYRLATYSKSTTTPQPLTQSTGNLTVLQTAGTLPVNLDIRHAVSEWDEPIVRNCKYIFRDNGEDSLVTGSTTVTYKHVVGGKHKLINLTQWFGRNREPSIDDFYKLFPTWKDADIPYDGGTILNYKGTGVRTIGFNAYNNATGTAVLLGGNKYQICGTYTSCSYEDQWGNAEELSIDDKGIFTPMNNGTLTVVGGNDTDTCVHLCWSGYKNFGEPDYEWFPYEEKGVEWDLSQWFPNGMNGYDYDTDTITNNSMTRKYGIHICTGTESLSPYSPNGVFFGISDMRIGKYMAGSCNLMPTDYDGSGSEQIAGAPKVFFGFNNKNVYLPEFFQLCEGDTVAEALEYLKELYDAGTPLVLIYPLATPVTSEVAPVQNFSYPVNDFGTEQSLPVNTLTLLTTDLDAEIRYSLDFTRTVANYSKIEDDVKQLVEEKDNLARQDGNYGDKGGVFNYATQLLDPNAPPTEASYGNRTAAGDVSIADNGTADVTSLQGTTQIQNQLVHDTNINTKSSTDGKLVLTDAVGGQLSRLEIHGGCVVHNQLVKESVEKTATGTGRLWVEDGVAGNAKSLVMTAPRSVVMNQWVDYTKNITSINSSAASVTNDSNTRTSTMSILDNVLSTGIAFSSTINKVYVNHVYLFTALVTASQNTTTRFLYSTVASPANTVDVQANTETRVSFVSTITSSLASMLFYVNVGGTLDNGDSVIVKDAMVVDLTQYFNGDTTLINSISTWDDLVAYDSAFASYVPYNTGIVQGVQPTVKVNHTTDVVCPVELFGVSNTAEDSYEAVSGTLGRKVGSVDMGTLEWKYLEASNVPGLYFFAVAGPSDAKHPVEGTVTIMSDKYVAAPARTFTQVVPSDKSIMMYISGGLYVFDSSYGSDAAAFKAAMSGVYLYYELATPITSQYNSTTIPTVDIYNMALQTAGTRSCGLSLTYDGKDQTITLDPTHTYVFNDNQEDDSVITGQSSIEAVGGEDQLVDITQFYNGDATKIANIHSWASLSTRFHRYRDLQPYNPGTVEPFTPTVRVFPNEHAYGILYDPSQNTPACQRVELNNGVLSEVASFDALSYHNCHNLYRCVMDDLANRHINYYLDDTDSTKKYNGTRNDVTSDGTQATLTGADGDVMVELPISYWDVDEDYNGTGKILYLMSDTPFMGSYYPAEIHDAFYVSPNGDTPRKQYIGAYRASICDENGNPLNTTEGALTQATGTSSTNKARSIAGALPYVSVSLADLTTRAGRNGASTVNTKLHQWLFLLMAVEYGTLDTQSISYGYAGGIQNAFCFWRKSGRVNAGNGTASITAVENTQDMDNFQKFTVGSTTVQRDTNQDADGRYAWSVYNRNASSTRYFTDTPTPSNGDVVYSASTGTTTAGTVASYSMSSNRTVQFQYRGIENPFGEVWEFEHGIQKYQTGEMKSFRGSDNVNYTRSVINDGATSRAWTDPSENVFWTTTGNLTTSTFLYSDPALTTATTVKYKDQPAYKYASEGYWETLATNDYTSTAQRTAATPTYTNKHNHWPLSGWDSKFDPVTFFIRKTGSPGASGRYLPDYFYNDGGIGDRVACRGGNASGGASDGLGYLYVSAGLSNASVSISGRLSA